MKKIYIVLVLIFLIIVVILSVLRKPKTPSSVETTPAPTTILPTKIIISPSPTPTLIPIAPFTGVLDVTIPQSTIDVVKQEQSLRKKTPVEEMYFTIAFDYAEDKFVVILKEPKTVSLEEFKKWRTANFNLIPEDRFTIK